MKNIILLTIFSSLCIPSFAQQSIAVTGTGISELTFNHNILISDIHEYDNYEILRSDIQSKLGSYRNIEFNKTLFGDTLSCNIIFNDYTLIYSNEVFRKPVLWRIEIDKELNKLKGEVNFKSFNFLLQSNYNAILNKIKNDPKLDYEFYENGSTGYNANYFLNYPYYIELQINNSNKVEKLIVYYLQD